MSSPRTLTNKEIKSLHAALKALDGRSDGGKFVAYELDVETRWDVATNISILQAQIEVIDSVSSAQLALHGLVDGESLTEDNRGRIQAFTADLKALLAKTSTIDLELLDKDKIRRLPIPPSVISALMPIIVAK